MAETEPYPHSSNKTLHATSMKFMMSRHILLKYIKSTKFTTAKQPAYTPTRNVAHEIRSKWQLRAKDAKVPFLLLAKFQQCMSALDSSCEYVNTRLNVFFSRRWRRRKRLGYLIGSGTNRTPARKPENGKREKKTRRDDECAVRTGGIEMADVQENGRRRDTAQVHGCLTTTLTCQFFVLCIPDSRSLVCGPSFLYRSLHTYAFSARRLCLAVHAESSQSFPTIIRSHTEQSNVPCTRLRARSVPRTHRHRYYKHRS